MHPDCRLAASPVGRLLQSLGRTSILALLAATALALGVAAPSRAAYPEKPIRIVVPAPAGGGSDVVARRLAEKLTESLGQQVIVDNRPGASGNLGTDLVAKAKPDGYTLLLANNGILAINPWLFRDLPYDVDKDLTPIIAIAKTPAVVVVREGLPVKSVSELVALAKRKDGVLTYGSGGVGSPQHVTGELFKTLTATHLTHVPYKGSAPVVMALLSGEVDVGFDYPVSIIQQVQAGRLRALAVAAPKRLAVMPEVPTATEIGLPEFVANAWVGVLAPAGTPKEIVDLLNKKLLAAARSPDYAQFTVSQAGEPILDSPGEFLELIRTERVRWGKLMNAAGVKPE